jgi:quercetin dioxygenase-like cupin family protein
MIRHGFQRACLAAAMFAAAAGPVTRASAHDGHAGKETIAPVMKQAIPEAPGHTAQIITVNYGPGQASDAHMHPGSIFAYVLEGEVVSQLDGQPPRTYRPGESWYEPPGARHLVSRNGSATAPAKLLVVAIVNGQTPIKQPLSR